MIVWSLLLELELYLFLQVKAQDYPHILVTAGLNGKHGLEVISILSLPVRVVLL